MYVYYNVTYTLHIWYDNSLNQLIYFIDLLKFKQICFAFSRQDTVDKKAAKDEEIRAARLAAIERKAAQGELAVSRRAESRCMSRAAAWKTSDFRLYVQHVFKIKKI